MFISTVPSSPTPKPISKVWYPNRTFLPELTWGRRLFRIFTKLLCKVVVFFFTSATITGTENYPTDGPALVVINHLGDPDVIIALAALQGVPEVIGSIHLREIPWLRFWMDLFGVIWVHRGRPDRQVISSVLKAFHQGRFIIIAPEARESTSGALEEGTNGAAYLALKGGVPIIPVTITGSEFRRIEKNLVKFRRTQISVTVGKPFFISQQVNFKDSLHVGTGAIMETLARQLPPEYRGFYAYVGETAKKF